jgi:hypothetical protein
LGAQPEGQSFQYNTAEAEPAVEPAAEEAELLNAAVLELRDATLLDAALLELLWAELLDPEDEVAEVELAAAPVELDELLAPPEDAPGLLSF